MSLKKIQKKAEQLPKWKQNALWKQLLFERKYCKPALYGKMKLISVIRAKIGLGKRPFLDEDFGSAPSEGYPYPAKLPSFLGVLGIIELQGWEQTAHSRKEVLVQLLNIFVNTENESHFSAYLNSATDIVPLRLAWSPKNGDTLRKELSYFVDTSWTWFLQPVVATEEPLEKFGYRPGTCTISESFGARMVNLPCNLNSEWMLSLKSNLAKQLMINS